MHNLGDPCRYPGYCLVISNVFSDVFVGRPHFGMAPSPQPVGGTWVTVNCENGEAYTSGNVARSFRETSCGGFPSLSGAAQLELDPSFGLARTSRRRGRNALGQTDGATDDGLRDAPGFGRAAALIVNRAGSRDGPSAWNRPAAAFPKRDRNG